MVENLSSIINLLSYVAIGGILLGLFLFVYLGMADNRELKKQVRQMKGELLLATRTGRSEEDTAEFERLHKEITVHLGAMKLKDYEIGKLTDLLQRAAEDKRRLEEDTVELKRLRVEAAAQLEGTKQKDQEIERLNDLLKRATEDQRRLGEAATKTARSEEDTAELKRLHTEVTAQIIATKQKDQEIERLNDLLKRATEDQRRLEEAAMKTGPSRGDTEELKRLRAEVEAHIGTTKQKDQEIAKLTDLLDRIFNKPEWELSRLQKKHQSDELPKATPPDESNQRSENPTGDIKNKEI